MHPYTTHQIAEMVGGRIQPASASPRPITRITHDSRRIPAVTEQLFLALHGPRHDGHQYLKEAYEKGVRAFMVDQTVVLDAFPEACFIQVENTNQALQRWARMHRKAYALPVIGITGSNGKTIVKEWLFQLLHDEYHIVRSPASYNSQVGVPLSVLQIESSHELGLFEAGISELGEMQHLAPIIDCNIGLFTNIGTAHAAGFVDQVQKIREKLILFEHAQVLIYCKDHQAISAALAKWDKTTFSWSAEGPADLHIQKIFHEKGSTQVEARYAGTKISIEVPYGDPASIENAIHCWAVLLYLGGDPERIKERMRKLKRLDLRLALRAGINHCILIDDTYNADLTSLKNALDFLDQQPKHLSRSIILSDFLQSGWSPDRLYREIAELIEAAGVRQLIGIGKEVTRLAKYLPTAVRTHFFADTERFLQADMMAYFSHEIILLKGARTFAFDRITDLLSAQQHRTVLEVNLAALAQNLAIFQGRLHPQTKVMIMVKAAAYGSGSLEVARRLAYLGVDYLAVAYVDEGVRLRQGGIAVPIMVLNPEPSAFATMLHYSLEPEVYTIEQLEELYSYAKGQGHDLHIHIKINTGMNRLGFSAPDLPDLLAFIKEHRDISIVSIFTHLAASEDPEEDAFSLQQIQIFQNQYESICQAIGYRPMRHVLNSAGIARFPQFQMEMVRLGIGLYGVLGGTTVIPHLQPVLSLKATVSQLKWHEAGTTVGYGRAGKLKRRTHLATVSIGYADGLPRQVNSDLYQVYIHHQPAPIIGHVCMDMCMVDVTDIPEVQYKDEVIIFGKAPSVEQLAAATGRIVYELLTGISSRVQRLYTS